MNRTLMLLAPALVLAMLNCAVAQPQVETVLSNLDNPSGITVHSESGDVYVSDSGAGRVIRVADGKAVPVVTDFPIDVYGKGPKYNIGPLGLGFLDKETLVVGGGGFKDGEELLRVYTLPAGGDAIKADAMKSSFKLAAEGDVKGEGNFYGIAIGKGAIYVTCNGDDTKGWVSKADVNGTKVGPFKRFIATKEAVEVDAPVAITMSPRGEVVVGQMGEITVPGDGLLTFYGTDGKKKLNLETGLSDLTALAYSQRSQQLYALDFSWADTSAGGLFQMIAVRKDGKQTVSAKKVVSLDKPTAMAFGKDGSLYITVIGTAEKDAKDKPGKLLRIAPGL